MNAEVEELLLQSREFKEAVARVQKRAERQENYEKLEDIFVETDLFTRLQGTDNQLILGRRGTGKTHMIRVFAKQQELTGNSHVYLDCTRFGSGFANQKELTGSQIGYKYFSSIINEICTQLLDITMAMENPAADTQETAYSKLTHVSDFFKPSLVDGESTFNYRQISDSLTQILDLLQIPRLFILIDEWAQIPLSSQPIVAEYLKRSIFPVTRISVKILAVNYQCEFYGEYNGDKIGMQRGADLPDIVEIDGYLVYDEKQKDVLPFFGQILYNHLGAELGWLKSASPEEKVSRISKLFTQFQAFEELVRACEGNSRDFLCVFSKSYYDGYLQNKGSKRINLKNVEVAALNWFETEKMKNINSEAEVLSTISFIFENVLKNYKSRTFMVEAANAENKNLLRLLNERILHKLNKRYSHPGKPGIRYDLFTLDYGSYLKFKGTKSAPQQDLFIDNDYLESLEESERKFLVPYDDRKSIRRIVFEPNSMAVHD